MSVEIARRGQPIGLRRVVLASLVVGLVGACSPAGPGAGSSFEPGSPASAIDTSPVASTLPSAPVTSTPSPVTATAGLVDIGGRSLYLECRGGTGVTVLLDADMNGDVSEFSKVRPLLPENWRVCAYNRLGEASSDSVPPGPVRTTKDMASDLGSLISAAGLPTPLVLVGNHFGGLVDLRFAAMHPDKVAALVLLDPMLPSVFMQFHLSCRGDATPDNPWTEGADLCVTLIEASKSALTPPDVPLAVLSRSDPQGFTPAEFTALVAAQRELAASVARGRQETVVSADVVPLDAPQAVADAIELVAGEASTP